MSLKAVNRILEKQWFPASFRFLTLIAFIVLVIIGFSSPSKDPFFISQLSKTNLTTIFVWRLWWPLIVLSAVIFGRVWCMICPVEMVTTFFSKIGLKLKRPRWILSGWVITIFYLLVLTVGISLLETDANTVYTSWYLLLIAGIAVISGFLFEKNTFCRYICPVGYLLGIFSKMSAWGWRVKKKSVCDSCSDKSCIKSKYTYQLNYKSCGVDLIPAEISNNNDCLLCGGCLKTCSTYKTENNAGRPNPGVVKIGFAGDLMKVHPFRLAEWVFLFLLTGSMIFEMTHFNIVAGTGNHLRTEKISTSLNLNEGMGKDIAGIVYLYLFLPLILWVLPFLVVKLFRINIFLKDYIKKMSLAFLPVIAAFFVGLAIMEIATKVPFYKYIIHDVSGIETIKAILFGQIEVPRLPLWSDWLFSMILIVSLIVGVIISFRVISKLIFEWNISRNREIMYAVPVIFILLIFCGALAYQLF